MKIAVFASGMGSNFEAICEAIDKGLLSAEVSLLVCDKPNAKVIEKAEKRGIKTYVFNAKDYASKADYEALIVKELQALSVDWVILAGYMRLVGETFLQAYPNKIINIHPSKLPDYKGKDAILQAYNAGETTLGVTVHYVDAGMDTGEIIAQETLEISENDSLESVEEKIHKIEHKLYPETLQKLFQGL